MAPASGFDALALRKRLPYPAPDPVTSRTSPPTRASLSIEGGFIEAWAQGYYVGSLIILILIVFCNYRSGVWLHKLILLELVLAIWHGTFIFFADPTYGWYLSSTATLLFISYFLHNVIAWLKIRPFLPLWGSRFFIISLICVQPFWAAEAWSNFEYFNSLGSEANIHMRPWEALFRDPWWIFTTWNLFTAVRKTYNIKLWTLIKINRRFGVMLLCMTLSIVFLLADVVVTAARLTKDSGINPYWRFALVFKCASDTIFLDDFKSVLDDITVRRYCSGDGTSRFGSFANPRFSGRYSFSGFHGKGSVDQGLFQNPFSPDSSTAVSSQASTSRTISLNPFKKQPLVPKIQVDTETTITSQAMQPGYTDWGNHTSLTRPAHAVRDKDRLWRVETDASLFNGRML